MEQIDPKLMEQYLKALEAEAMNNAISQSDGVTIYQSEPTAPGVYVSTEQQAQDAYNDMLLQRQAMLARQSQQLPRYQEQADMSMGNPNYKVEEPRQMAADGNGNIVIY